MQIGAQLYTVREFCKDLDGVSETLKKIADIGYKSIQYSGCCDCDPEWLKSELDKNGLKCVLTHTSPDRLKNEIEKVVKVHDIIGCDYVGLGWFGFDKTHKSDDFYNEYKPIAKKLCKSGKYFMYHNHDGEFQKENGKLILQTLADRFSPTEMGFTLDTYWIQAGGGDPSFWIESFKDRVPCIHLKDYAYGGKMAVIGECNLNFDRIFHSAEKSGTKYMLVEQDDCYGEDPFKCLKRSYNNLHTLGFE